jgi:hypothetical protein
VNYCIACLWSVKSPIDWGVVTLQQLCDNGWSQFSLPYPRFSWNDSAVCMCIMCDVKRVYPWVCVWVCVVLVYEYTFHTLKFRVKAIYQQTTRGPCWRSWSPASVGTIRYNSKQASNIHWKWVVVAGQWRGVFCLCSVCFSLGSLSSSLQVHHLCNGGHPRWSCFHWFECFYSA